MGGQMKDSGIEWFGMIPHEWKIVQVKRLFKIGRGRVIATTELSDKGFPVYSSQTKNSGILGYIDTYDFDRSQLTWTTDGANAGTVFLREGKHNCTNVCGTLMPYTMEYNLKYLKYILEYTAIFHKRADINGYKIMNNEMADIHILLPDQDSQNSIAEYLDEQYIHIGCVLEKIRASIEEYKKLKQAVTKGIRGDREMKDSGIEWIGEVPIEWEVSQVKYSLKWKSKKGQPQEEVLSLYRDYGIVPKDSRDDNHNVTSLDTSGYKVVDIGDFVINKMKAWQGSMAVSEYRGIISPAYHVCEFTNDKLNKKYFHYLMRNKSYMPEYTRLSTGMRVGQWDLGFDDFKNIRFLLPPQEEQQEIVNYLDEKCSAIDDLIAKKEQYLSEIENYKKSLVYEYVTGKKEV